MDERKRERERVRGKKGGRQRIGRIQSRDEREEKEGLREKLGVGEGGGGGGDDGGGGGGGDGGGGAGGGGCRGREGSLRGE